MSGLYHSRNATSTGRERLPRLLLDRLFGLTVEGSLTQRFSLVVELLSSSQDDLYLDPVPDQDHRRRNHRQPLLLDLGGKPLDLPLVHEQTPWAAGLMARVPAVFIGADVATHEHGFATREVDMGVGEVDPTGPDCLDLGATQLDAGDLVFEEVVEVAGAAILGNHPTLLVHTTTLARASTTVGSN